MDARSAKFQQAILKQYSSIKAFAVKSGIPYTTLRSGLQNGIGGMAFDKVMYMCDVLYIDPHTFEEINK